MNEKAKITFYQIKDCGFYQRGEDAPEFGSVLQLLTDLDDWSNGKPLVETKTFEPRDGQDIHPAYLLDIKSLNGSWLLTTWNQTPAHESGLASVRGESSVGEAEVVMNAVNPGTIPGFATYFWFLPSRGLFASVRFQHLWTGQKSLQCYLESFLETFSRHVVFGEDEDAQVVVVGYQENAGDEPRHLYPKFRTSLVQKPGRRDFIRQNVDSVRKVLRKTTLRLNRVPDHAWWQDLLHKTKMSEPQVKPEHVKIQYEMITALSLTDVDAMIEDWDAHHEREWDDYGFELRGESNKTHWFSHSLARAEFELNVERDNEEVVNAESLLAALDSAKANILRILE